MNNCVNDLKYFFDKYYPTIKYNFYKGLIEDCYHFRIDYSTCFDLIDVIDNNIVLTRVKGSYGVFLPNNSPILFKGDLESFKKAMFNNEFGMADYKIAPVEKIKMGEFVRKSAKGKVFTKGEYDRYEKKYVLDDYNDISRCVYVKKGEVFFFIYEKRCNNES